MLEVRLSRRRAFALAALLALASPTLVGWFVALHLATGHGDEVTAREGLDPSGLEVVVHGHTHVEGTPTHGHPLLRGVGASVPVVLLVQLCALTPAAAESFSFDLPRSLPLSSIGPTVERPPRATAFSVLRI